jgi:hypothetical protein
VGGYTLRSYIFTEVERRRLEAWLKTHAEDHETLSLFTRLRRNFAPIRRDIELYSKLADRLRKEGRFIGRVRLHQESVSQSPSGGSGSTLRRREPST